MSDEDVLEWWPFMSREDQTEWIAQSRQRHASSGMLPSLQSPVAIATTTATDESAHSRGIDSGIRPEGADISSDTERDGLTVVQAASGRGVSVQPAAEDDAAPDQQNGLMRPATTAAEWLAATRRWGLATPLPLPLVRLASDTEVLGLTPGPSGGPLVAVSVSSTTSSTKAPKSSVSAAASVEVSLDAFIDFQDDELGHADGADMHRTPWAMMCSQEECTCV
jgi:hypothetical protein